VRRSARLAFGSGGGAEPTDQVLGLADADWRRIETAYGYPLTVTVRSAINQATEAFLFLQSVERTALPVAEVRVVLEAYDKAAGRFFNVLFDQPSGSSTPGVYARHLIDQDFHDVRVGGEVASFDTLLHILRAFHIACNRSIKQLSEPSMSSALQQGDSWMGWIYRLTEILNKVELPTLTRKNLSDAEQSPFVLFVWELQKCLAEESRHHTSSKTALADAISEAQAKTQS
jgi:hypothetical protein